MNEDFMVFMRKDYPQVEDYPQGLPTKWRMLKKCSHEIPFARRLGARLPYPTQTGGHQVCITRKNDPALRLLTNRGRETHLFASFTEARLGLR